jgi:hypothetical protein
VVEGAHLQQVYHFRNALEVAMTQLMRCCEQCFKRGESILAFGFPLFRNAKMYDSFASRVEELFRT